MVNLREHAASSEAEDPFRAWTVLRSKYTEDVWFASYSPPQASLPQAGGVASIRSEVDLDLLTVLEDDPRTTTEGTSSSLREREGKGRGVRAWGFLSASRAWCLPLTPRHTEHHTTRMLQTTSSSCVHPVHDPTILVFWWPELSNLRVTVDMASSVLPKKFSSDSRKVNSTPTSRAVAFSSARREPWKGAKASPAAVEAFAPAPTAAETFQEAEMVREAAPEEARPSRWRVPQRPTV